MKKTLKLNQKIAIITLLIISAVLWRLINNHYMIAPNLELITATSVIAALLFNYRAGMITAFGSMVVSDLIIGNSPIFIYTWTSFLLIGAGAGLLKKINGKNTKQIFASIGFAIISSLAFFLITNFGVWLEGWYSMNLAGFIECFTLAIPFYRTMLIGNIILVPSSVAALQYFKARQNSKNLVINSTVS